MFYLCLTLALFDVFVYAGDGPLLRNFVIASGALKPLLALAHNSMNNVSNIHARGFSLYLIKIQSSLTPETLSYYSNGGDHLSPEYKLS